MYSASVVDKAISVCIFDDQCMGHPAQVITYPILDLAVLGSDDAVCCSIQKHLLHLPSIPHPPDLVS
jgi:hypothetical protein